MKYSPLLLVLFMLIAPVLHAAESEQFTQRVRATGMLQDQESILLGSNVYFYPRKKGLGLLGGGNKRIKGQIVLTEQALSILEWQRIAKVYHVIHHEKYSDMQSVELRGGSLVTRLVTQNKSTGVFNSFEIMDSRNSMTANPEKMRNARQIIQQGIAGLEVRSTSQDTQQVQHNSQADGDSLEARIQRLENALIESAADDDKECNCECPQ